MRKMVGFKDLAAYGITYTYAHVWQLQRAGRFPKAIKMGASKGARIMWLESEISAWVQARVDARDAA